ncbi:MAG: FHA domain-containing protein [Pyrinomonadaceae bacterium]
MLVTLQVKEGPFAGKKTLLREGQIIEVGRTERAGFVVPDDPLISSLHFALECGDQSCRILDRNSRNGTFLNGTRINEAVISDNDEIVAGQTVFTVRVFESTPALDEAASTAQVGSETTTHINVPKRPRHKLVVGSWSFATLPEGWEIIDGYGVRRAGKGVFPSNVIVGEDHLSDDKTLQQYIDAQIELLRQHFIDPQIELSGPANITGADEAIGLTLRYKSPDGRPVIQRQTYARRGQTVGALTMTTVEDDWSRAEPFFKAIVSGLVLNEKQEQTLSI